MARTPFAPWDASRSWILRIEAFRGKSLAHDAPSTRVATWRGLHTDVPRPGRYLDVPRLLSWLSARQYAPEGGFSGRTNKLVDGCYSHWVGGCWPLIEASLNGPEGPATEPAVHPPMQADDSLFSRNGLIRYILCCGQDLSKRGGMRDKPSK